MQTIQHAVKKKPEKISVGLFFEVEGWAAETFKCTVFILFKMNEGACSAKQFFFVFHLKSKKIVNNIAVIEILDSI